MMGETWQEMHTEADMYVPSALSWTLHAFKLQFLSDLKGQIPTFYEEETRADTHSVLLNDVFLSVIIDMGKENKFWSWQGKECEGQSVSSRDMLRTFFPINLELREPPSLFWKEAARD